MARAAPNTTRTMSTRGGAVPAACGPHEDKVTEEVLKKLGPRHRERPLAGAQPPNTAGAHGARLAASR